jgi:hypothetical protein
LSIIETKPNPRVGGSSSVPPYNRDGAPFVITVRSASEEKARCERPGRGCGQSSQRPSDRASHWRPLFAPSSAVAPESKPESSKKLSNATVAHIDRGVSLLDGDSQGWRGHPCPLRVKSGHHRTNRLTYSWTACLASSTVFALLRKMPTDLKEWRSSKATNSSCPSTVLASSW